MFRIAVALNVRDQDEWSQQLSFEAQDNDPMALIEEAAAALATLRQRYVLRQNTRRPSDEPTEEMPAPFPPFASIMPDEPKGWLSR